MPQQTLETPTRPATKNVSICFRMAAEDEAKLTRQAWEEGIHRTELLRRIVRQALRQESAA